ncbi:DNA-binding protein (plasmid) [Acidovorax sp. DW039]|uniref:DNA-binding protein n=1 Tax=Acidovorax sp. DW039 TaxID=3095606 RepID=UPI00308B3F26|nr:DNA-binding protein [Acidovorax sp. DW039]
MQENSAENHALAYPAITAALRDLPVGAGRKEKTKLVARMLFLDFGIHPSAKVVLDFTRQGSMSDISRDLREFWEELRKRIRLELQVPVVPEQLQEAFSEALSKMWALSSEHAQQSLEVTRQECELQVHEAQGQVQAAQHECAKAWSQVEALGVQMAALQERLVAAEKRSEALVAEVSALEAKAQSWKDQAESAAAERKESETRFLQELEKERAERRVEAERFGGEINFAKRQIDTARQAEKDVREQLQMEKASKDAEVTTYRQRMNKTEEALIALRAEHAQANSQKAWLQDKVAELQERVKELAKAGSAKAPRAPRRAAIKRSKLR